MAEVNQEERAYGAWDILISRAINRKTITYKELGDALGVHHRACRYFLGLIQDFCLNEKLPPLTILVVNRNGDIGQGFTAWDVNNIKEGLEKVYSYNWNNIYNPFEYASNGETKDGIARKLINKEVDKKELYARVKVRGVAQSIFRKALLEAYNYRCAFCRTRIEVLLEAAHIIPWSKSSEEQKLDVNNGILLCSNHHKLFDAGLINIDKDYRIHADPTIKTKLIGRKMRLPEDERLHPSKESLVKRLQLI
ncbi:HNH endonuclease [Ornithinibacillus halophilus]|uniref:Putative restriction endonuclease n=1 Tax=Ornithinibacillus halophilus TaxID=930117 RepID=A0A1M5JB00_9BACI|nr:HNH endonuclease signature motif containing protein [Ornithinibacillus halophilus]SHG37742.1 putative restriction endonuclease [Ornithinibacillus halophilus]